jgi:hypothetical protein
MACLALFAGAELIGEFKSRADGERARDELVAAEPSAADELALFELHESGDRVGEPITRASAL